jgi:hypothetical protein
MDTKGIHSNKINMDALIFVFVFYMIGYIYFHLYFKYKERQLREPILPTTNTDNILHESNIIQTNSISYKKEYNEQCSICLESFHENEILEQLTCGHYYHKTCIKQWFDKKNSTCPLCRIYLV